MQTRYGCDERELSRIRASAYVAFTGVAGRLREAFRRLPSVASALLDRLTGYLRRRARGTAEGLFGLSDNHFACVGLTGSLGSALVGNSPPVLIVVDSPALCDRHRDRVARREGFFNGMVEFAVQVLPRVFRKSSIAWA